VNPMVLAQRLQLRSQTQQSDAKKLQKSAVRACTDRLVSSGGLKFRRSAFRGAEPRVTLLVPVSLGFFTDPIPVDFSVNAVTPFYTAALLSECGQMEPRAKALILFVKRWAKDRGICHAAKGHLSPYLWSLLVIYFMQVGMEDEAPLLPALEAFAISSGLISSSLPPISKVKASRQQVPTTTEELSIGLLFYQFVHFYSQRFNWNGEAISIRLGRRAPPDASLPVHVGLTIEDPFEAGNNLGTCMNAMSLARLREEFVRAGWLCADSSSLSELLVPWAPAEDGIQWNAPAVQAVMNTNLGLLRRLEGVAG
jgi:DNA polymerase sigma